MQNTPFALWLAALGAIPSSAAPRYAARPDDPQAVNLTKDNFSVRGDGVADDTAAIPQAIDKAARTGVVFIPEGRDRIASGGDREPPNVPIDGAVLSSAGNEARIQIFVYVRDPAGKAATADVPLLAAPPVSGCYLMRQV